MQRANCYSWAMLSKRCILLLGVFCATAATANSREHEAEPLRVEVDSSQVPELSAWASDAARLVEKWHPRIAALLPTDGFTPPAHVTLVIEKSDQGVAATAGSTIRISSGWVKKHPDDFGMVVHELTHVIQSYPPSDAGWLVEGIADYVRYYHFEPQARLAAIDPARQSYRDGYRTAAMFLAWIERTHDADIVRKLNTALRRSQYKYDLFKQATTKSLDRLWADFLDDKASRGR